MTAKITQILNFKANFHKEFELVSRKKIYANNTSVRGYQTHPSCQRSSVRKMADNVSKLLRTKRK